MKPVSIAAAVLIGTVLAGCGGGGGGPTVTVSRRPAPAIEPGPCGNLPWGEPVPCVPYLPVFPGDPQGGVPRVSSPRRTTYSFTSWSELKTGYDVMAWGQGMSSAFTYDTAPTKSGQEPRITAVSGPYSSNDDQPALLQFGPAGQPYLIQVGGYALPPEGVYFHSETLPGVVTLAAVGEPGIDVGRQLTSRQSPFTSATTGHFVLIANPKLLGWEYQSFGVWNDNAPGRIGGFGAMVVAGSYGAATPASAVPASGNASFAGKLAGLYVSPSGQGATAAGNLSVQANFAARSLSFTSTGTSVTRDLATATAAPHLNLSGTLTYAPGSNAFSGTLTSAAGTLSGPSRGQFYGPAAQELGGLFTLKSSGNPEAFIGAYGAKR